MISGRRGRWGSITRFVIHREGKSVEGGGMREGEGEGSRDTGEGELYNVVS